MAGILTLTEHSGKKETSSTAKCDLCSLSTYFPLFREGKKVCPSCAKKIDEDPSLLEKLKEKQSLQNCSKTESKPKMLCNMLYRGPRRKWYQKIQDVLEKANRPLQPREIADKTGIKRNSCRVYLRQLLEAGEIEQPLPGYYKSGKNFVTGAGVGGLVKVFEESVPRMHGLCLRIETGFVLVRGKIGKVEFLGGQVSFVQAGPTTVTVFVDCGDVGGLDLVGWRLLIGFVKKWLNVKEEAILVSSCEFNNDFEGLQIDGKAMTIKHFDDLLVRLYNKTPTKLRREVVVPKNLTTEQVDFLLRPGGVSAYNILQGLYGLVQKDEQLTEAVKLSNRSTVNSVRELIKSFLEAIGDLKETIETLPSEIVKAIRHEQPVKEKRRRAKKRKPLSRLQLLRRKLPFCKA